MRIRYIITLMLAIALLMTGCSEEILTSDSQQEVMPGDTIVVDIDFSVSGMQPSTRAAQTRAVNDAETFSTDMIKNLWVLQFSGTANDSRLIHWQYISDFKYEDYSSASGKTLKFIDTGAGGSCTVVFLANTYKQWLFNSTPSRPYVSSITLADIKGNSYKNTVKSEQDLFGINGTVDNTKSYPDNADYHIMLSGSFTGTIHQPAGSAAEKMSVTLTPNIAKVKVNIENTSASSGNPVTITGAQLRQVADRCRYYATYGSSEEYPATSEMSPIDYPVESIKADESTWSHTWYVPVNLRGTGNLVKYRNYSGYYNKSQPDKCLSAPEGATYLQINGKYKDEGMTDSVPVTYKYYLGDDLANDFNLKPGYEYVYNININSRKAACSDYRVSDWGAVDFSNEERANCYILNPAPIGTGYDRAFTIPVDRVNTFWKSTKYVDRPSSSQYFAVGNKWKVFIIWSDFNNSDGKVYFEKDAGDVADDNDLGSFTVRVKPGTKGNVVVGIRRDDNSGVTNCLWSWHLWITDYNPDEVSRQTHAINQYVYPVTGGNMHTYGGDVWAEGGTYYGKYIMDRNLGALSAKQKSGAGCLYYQYGRKDPFCVDAVYPGTDGASYFNSGELKIENENTPAVGDNNVTTAIMNPATFYYFGNSSSWTLNTKYNNTSYTWFDPDCTVGTNGKSLFDPCPPGYKVPEASVSKSTVSTPWNDFMGTDEYDNNKTLTKTNMDGGYRINYFPEKASTEGMLYYWPVMNSSQSTYIRYPLVGVLMMVDKKIRKQNYGKYADSWTAVQRNSNNGYCLEIRVDPDGSESATDIRNHNRNAARGLSVRCIKE